MNEYLIGVVALLVLLFGNAFFVGAEFAVISARRSQVEPLAEAGNRRARTALWAMEHATLMLATSQLGITVCSLVILNVSEPAIHHLLEIPLEWLNIPVRWVTISAFFVALSLVTFLHVVFGEMVPKNLAFSVPDRAVLLLAPPLVMVSRLVRPVIWTLNGIANGVLRLCGVEPKDEATSTYTLDQIATIVEESTQHGTLEDASGTLTASFEFTEKIVGDVEVPWQTLVRLPATSTPADIQRAAAEYGYSRYILADDRGDPTGYIHIKDVLDLVKPRTANVPVPADRIRPLDTLNRDAEIEDALAELRLAGDHLAKVVDSTGALTGVLFLEDIIEQLVGEVHDATRKKALRPVGGM
ncbi:MAG: HlyC/CorC family transporter [Thermomicrobiales bacterium]|nr:HlyC/CorC family transporter [Thermomicrobiales bacterium]